jgi:hypothetical protein
MWFTYPISVTNADKLSNRCGSLTQSVLPIYSFFEGEGAESGYLLEI